MMTQNVFSNDGEIPPVLAKKRKAIVDPSLAKALKFDAHDLMTNRNNKLTEHQKKNIIKHRSQAFWDFMTPFTWLGLLPLLGWLCMLQGHPAFISVISVPTILLMSSLPLLIGRVLIELSSLYRIIIRDIQAGDVDEETGVVILDGRRMFKRKGFMLIINEEAFNISREGFLRFKHLERYIIYYLPKSKIIVSAEPAE